MKPLAVLLITSVFAFLAIRWTTGKNDLAFAARIGLSAMLVFTAVAHFAFSKGMMMMLPDFLPFKKPIIYLTGFIEVLAAIGLFLPSLRVITGWLLIAFFVLVFPANIKGAIRHVDYQKATYEGRGVNYLYFRVLFQILLVVWVFLFVI